MTIARRRAGEIEEWVVRKEARTTAALVTDPATVVRVTATLGAGALEAVAVATFGAALLAALVAVVLCVELFFFFFVVVVGVPDKSSPDSSIAAVQFQKRRII